MRTQAEGDAIRDASEDFRERTMEVLRLAFLSTAVLEFFAALSVALVAVYFGFSYIDHLNFGHYGSKVTLFTGLFVLFLAPSSTLRCANSAPTTTPRRRPSAPPNSCWSFSKPR